MGTHAFVRVVTDADPGRCVHQDAADGAEPDSDGDDSRVRALEDLGVLDTGREARFDRITGLARRLFGVASAAVTLIDRDRQYVKSNEGAELLHGPRSEAFCDHTIRRPEALVVEDAAMDTRFADNPLVTGGANIRFYAGHPLTVPGGHRVGALCLLDERPRTFTRQERDLLEELAGWVQQELVHSADLEQAAQVQRSLMPRRPPQIGGFDVAGVCLPSRAVGGDFLDWYPTRDGGLAVTLGDVMGKGMAAALVMAMVRTAMRSTGRSHTAADALSEAAEALYEDLDETGTLVTCCHAVLRPHDNIVRFADAGHGLMLLVRTDGSVHRRDAEDLPLGVLPDVRWLEAGVSLEPGDVVLTFSDGLLDLYPGPLEHALLKVAAVIQGAVEASEMVERFAALARRAAPLDDDVTVLAIRRLP